MEIDVARVLGRVRRTVHHFGKDGKDGKDGKPASTVTLSRVYGTDVEDLWNALTSKKRIAGWFAPIEGELRLGGRYQVKGNAGGIITACTPTHHFSATWEFGGATSWIDVAVGAEDGWVRVTLAHTAIIEDHWKQ